MLSSFRRCLSLLRPTKARKLANISFSSSTQASKFYEIRNYEVKPKYFFKFMELMQENDLSQMDPDGNIKQLGFWTVEYGGLCQVLHMYEFDNHRERNTSITAVMNNPKWISFIGTILHMFVKQENVILNAFPWHNVVEKPDLKQGVYELQRTSVLPGKLEQFSHRAQQTIEDRTKYSQLLGIWYSEFGDLNQVYHLWHYVNVDKREKIIEQVKMDEMCQAAAQDLELLTSATESKLMIPASFSAWQ